MKDAHCSHCGAKFAATDSYPRTCPDAACGQMTWANPIPVAVVLIPIAHDGRDGLVVIRRAIEPRAGMLALVGGFVDLGETWQAGGAREVKEEIGADIDAGSIEPFWYASTEPNPNRVLLFSIAAPMTSANLPAFEVTNETSERGAVFGPDGLDDVFAFNLHADAARRHFADRGIGGPHAYTEL